MRISDIVSRVAIRPAALNLYSPNLLEFILRKNKDHNVIHLGDALNVGCRNEWDQFTEVMSQSVNNNWIMTPGNHDFYFYGITSGGWWHDIFRSSWEDGCVTHLDTEARTKKPKQLNEAAETGKKSQDANNNVLTKHQFLDQYLRHLRTSNIINVPSTPTMKIKGMLGADVDITTAVNTDGFYRKVVVHKYTNLRKHRSFITQFVNLSTDEKSPTVGVLVDTTNYHFEPTNIRGAFGLLSHNAGLHGYVSKHQIEVIDESLKDFNKNSLVPIKVLFMGHHPFESLNIAMKRYLHKQPKDRSIDFQGYISAHTHSGFTAMHDDGYGNLFKEYNIGSIIDWPVETATSSQQQGLINSINLDSLHCDKAFDYSSSKVSNYTAYLTESHSLLWPGEKLINAQHRYYIQAMVRAISDLDLAAKEPFDTIYAGMQFELQSSQECGLFFARNCQDRKRIVIENAISALRKVNRFQPYAVCQALWSSQSEYLAHIGNHTEDN